MQAKNELMQLKAKLQKQIAVLESEMTTVDAAIHLIERENRREAAGPEDKRFRKMGLSEACRQIVGPEWISPAEVRTQMMQGGFKNHDKAKLLSAVFATLKRLAQKEFEGKKIDGKMKYRTRPPAASNAAEAA